MAHSGLQILVSALLCSATIHCSDDPIPYETLVMNQAKAIEQLQARVTAMESTQHQATQTINQLTTDNTALKADIADFKARLAKQETKVAFSVHFTTPTLTVTGIQTIIFDLVDLNQGNAYDNLTGMFTAPVSGLYEFNLHLSIRPPGRMQVHIIKNGVEVAETEASGDDMKYFDRASNSVFVQMSAGQRIWVRRATGDATTIDGDFRSSFSGALIIADH